jgi:DNA mismatch repair protein MutS
MANVHLDATEYQDHVVFLHHIQEGPANRSFGLQVARLAGIPAPVLAAASEKLAELEGDGMLQAASSGVAGKSAPAQNDLFSVAPPHPLITELEKLDVDALSPRDALELLYRLKSRLD